MKNKRLASLRTSDFGDAAHDPVEQRKIARLTQDEVKHGYLAPPNEDAYFSHRSPPEAWEASASLYSMAHIFLQTTCLVVYDGKLDETQDTRKRLMAIQKSRSTPPALRKMIRTTLANRPVFAVTRLVLRKGARSQCNAWDKKLLRQFAGTAKKYNIPATVLWLVYSSKAMLTSKLADADTDELAEKLVAEWNKWLDDEHKELLEMYEIAKPYECKAKKTEDLA